MPAPCPGTGRPGHSPPRRDPGVGLQRQRKPLVRYLDQGRADGDCPVTTPRHASRLLLTDPENLRAKEATLLEKITAACPEMTALADLIRGFATLLNRPRATTRNSPSGSRQPAPSTCPTCAASPTASKSTGLP